MLQTLSVAAVLCHPPPLSTSRCRQELPCREREVRASSTSSLEEWSTTTIRAKKHSDRTLVRVATRSQGQLVKVSMEQDTFASMKAELGAEQGT